ncbi:MAG: hypothetical protein ACRDRV_03645, partial [Pseudonocardiaceae bacterium]
YGYAVLLDVTAWGAPADRSGNAAPDPVQTAGVLHAAGWSVEVTQPQRALSSVWEQLCVNSRNEQGARR